MPRQSPEGGQPPVTDTVNHYWDCTGGFMPHPRSVSWHDLTAPHGTEIRSGLPIIGRTTPINHGIWINHGEFLVIDDSDKRERKSYQKVLDVVERRIEEVSSATQYQLPVDSALRIVAGAVSKVIPWDPKRAEYANRVFGGHPLQLTYFIDGNWGGVCRHQAALGGYICEKLAKMGALDTEVFLNRNKKGGPDGPGHAWVRLESRASDLVYILDITQDAVGVIDDMGAQHWPYRQPLDPEIYTGDAVE